MQPQRRRVAYFTLARDEIPDADAEDRLIVVRMPVLRGRLALGGRRRLSTSIHYDFCVEPAFYVCFVGDRITDAETQLVLYEVDDEFAHTKAIHTHTYDNRRIYRVQPPASVTKPESPQSVKCSVYLVGGAVIYDRHGCSIHHDGRKLPSIRGWL